VRRTERQRDVPGAAQKSGPSEARGPAASLLRLQRGAGNAAVGRILGSPLLQRAGWHEARSGGWNEKAQSVAGTLRIPIDGLPIGYQEQDVVKKDGPTTEHAGEKDSARAIVIVPDGTKFDGGKLEVLLLYHGLGATAGIAYREKASTDKEGIGAEGTVHDVENDLIPQQLKASGRNMIAILPQGHSTGQSKRFLIPHPAAYVAEVLKKLKTELATLAPKVTVPSDITPLRIVSAGHSGGGPYALDSAVEEQGGDWSHAAPLLLFDGINGPNELRNLRRVLQKWLEADERVLLAAADPAAELTKRGLKFRSTYSEGSDTYLANHEGGKYELSNGAKVTISDSDPDNVSLNFWLDQWFKAHAKGPLGGAVGTQWRKQYATEKVTGGHHHQIGTGAVAGPGDRDKPPAGITGASQKAGVPKYKPGTGHLEQSLRLLP
jgi:hypothetical protein